MNDLHPLSIPGFLPGVDESKRSKYRHWWDGLEDQWQKAFRESGLHHDSPDYPTDIQGLPDIEVLRLSGPTAPFPNLSFELTNLSGIRSLKKLKILIIIHHQIEDLTDLSHLTSLTDIFLFNNRIQSLEGVRPLTKVEKLYVQNNRIGDLAPIAGMKNLRELYVYNNELELLQGLQESHSDTLRTFVCLPNKDLRQKEIIRVENQLGIRCK